MRQFVLLAAVPSAFFVSSAQAQFLDQIGLTTLRALTTNLNGAGVIVGQAEASAPAFEVNPSIVGQPINLFTWIAGNSPYTNPPSQSSTFTNSIGTELPHADNVGNDFYGIPNGVATNVAHINNYDADTFANYYINYDKPITEHIVNQSFTFGSVNAGVDQIYDDYAAQHNVLFLTGAERNGYPVASPATCYNGIGVGVFNNGGSSYGPTPDGRSKPDITAFGLQDSVTSYSTPQVSGAAALLLQAGLRGDGGVNIGVATDIRTLKALLLNGAVKPADWTNSPSVPLHYRYGAGVLNVFNSYEQLAGGKQSSSATNLVASGAAHPPVTPGNFISAGSGWDFSSITSDAVNDAVKHYFFNVSDGMATLTLVWNRQFGQTAINDLDLFLYDCATSNLVACSTSRVDNVEHIFVPKLPAGQYDLQVLKNGGASVVSDTETYALAFAFVPKTLTLVSVGTSAVLTWPAYPAGFRVEAATNLTAPVWSTNNLPITTLTNSTNTLQLPLTNALQFFRLRQPNF